MVVTDTLVMAPRRIDGPVRLVVPVVAGAEPTVSSRRHSPGPTEARRPGRHFVAGGSDIRRRGRTAPVLGLGAAPVVPQGARILAPHNMPALYARIDGLRQDPRVAVQEIGAVQGHAMHALRITDPSDGPKLKVLITAGVHGNEPCGPGAAMLMIDQLLADPKQLKGLDVTILPALNPRGLIAKSRRTPEDVDLNRVYGTDGAPEEARIAAGYLAGQRYDLAMDLHSGAKKRNGFWALHRNAADLLTPALRNLGQRWPLLSGDTKPYTMTSPGVGTSKNRSTLKDFIFNEGTPRTATLEAPGSVDYLQQVLGENAMMHSIVAELRKAAEQGQAGVA